jgi:uncharacterized caspase-like protein
MAGYGFLDDNLDYYFASTDLSLTDMAGTGVPYETIEGLLDAIPARQKLLMMDTCHAGDVDTDRRAPIRSTGGDGSRGLGVVMKSAAVQRVQPVQSLGKELVGVFDLMKSLFVNLDKGSGAVVISAAAADQYALESDEWQNGVFIYSVLEGLQSGSADTNEDGGVSATELHKHVVTLVEELTDGEQIPTTRREQAEFDFIVF